MREVAINSWALVIFLIDPAERMRPRSSRSVAGMSFPGCLLLLRRRSLADLHRFFTQLFLVECLDMLIRHHRTAASRSEAPFELVDDLDELVAGLVGELLGCPDVGKDRAVVRGNVVGGLGEGTADV